MRNIQFEAKAFVEYKNWISDDPAIFEKINELIVEISREPFKGKGKPEPLKGNYYGCWSRRITLEHRLIYRVDTDTVFVLKCHGHYE